MRIIADTNLLARMFLADDLEQQGLAFEAVAAAESIAIGTHALCELVWLLDRRYRTPRAKIASVLRVLLATRNAIYDLPAIAAGLAMLDDGGDFADGVIAYEGRALGGDTFVSFDKKAVARLERQGLPARILS